MLLHRLLERGTYFTHVQFVDPLNSYPLGRSLEKPNDKGATLVEVDDVLTVEDLEFPILLDKSEDGDTIVIERGPGNGSDHYCDLRRGYVL